MNIWFFWDGFVGKGLDLGDFFESDFFPQHLHLAFFLFVCRNWSHKLRNRLFDGSRHLWLNLSKLTRRQGWYLFLFIKWAKIIFHVLKNLLLFINYYQWSFFGFLMTILCLILGLFGLHILVITIDCSYFLLWFLNIWLALVLVNLLRNVFIRQILLFNLIPKLIWLFSLHKMLNLLTLFLLLHLIFLNLITAFHRVLRITQFCYWYLFYFFFLFFLLSFLELFSQCF